MRTHIKIIYTKLYDKQEFDWLYYYVYIILLKDSHEEIIDKDLYKKIIDSMIVIYQIMVEKI